MLDDGAVMQDRDIGEMFLNFMLHPSARRFAGIDLRPLNLSKEECRAAFLCWMRLLMGFRASPYNSIRTYLIAEEVIRGDRHDPSNAFQWHSVDQNLPGTEDWIIS